MRAAHTTYTLSGPVIILLSRRTFNCQVGRPVVMSSHAEVTGNNGVKLSRVTQVLSRHVGCWMSTQHTATISQANLRLAAIPYYLDECHMYLLALQVYDCDKQLWASSARKICPNINALQSPKARSVLNTQFTSSNFRGTFPVIIVNP